MKNDKQKLPLLVIAGTSLILALSGCFDWQVPDDYEPWHGPDGDADGDIDGDVDGDVDGDGDGDGGHGDPCFEEFDCADPFACTWGGWDERRYCRQRCPSTAECERWGVNSVCVPGWFGFDGSACTMDCEMGSNWGCPPDTHCQFVVLDDSGDPVRAGTICAESIGWLGFGETCVDSSECDAPFMCIFTDGEDGICVNACWNPGEACEGGDCLDTFIQMLDGSFLGVCFPPL